MEDQTMQIDTEYSQERDKIAPAMVKAQAAIKPAELNKVAKVKGTTRNGGMYEYEYRYADLNSVRAATNEPLTSNGIAVVVMSHIEYMPIQQPNNQTIYRAIVYMTTTLLHESGQWCRCMVSLMAKDDAPQSVGSAMTYGRRYGLSCLTNVSCEGDDDGNIGQGNDASIEDKKSAKTGSSKAEPSKAESPRGTRARGQGTKAATPPPAVQEASLPPPERQPGEDSEEDSKKTSAAESNGSRTMTDAERLRLGLINKAQYDALIEAVKAAAIAPVKWLTWLKGTQGFNKAAEIRIATYQAIMDVVQKAPATINDYNQELRG